MTASACARASLSTHSRWIRSHVDWRSASSHCTSPGRSTSSKTPVRRRIVGRFSRAASNGTRPKPSTMLGYSRTAARRMSARRASSSTHAMRWTRGRRSDRASIAASSSSTDEPAPGSKPASTRLQSNPLSHNRRCAWIAASRPLWWKELPNASSIGSSPSHREQSSPCRTHVGTVGATCEDGVRWSVPQCTTSMGRSTDIGTSPITSRDRTGDRRDHRSALDRRAQQPPGLDPRLWRREARGISERDQVEDLHDQRRPNVEQLGDLVSTEELDRAQHDVRPLPIATDVGHHVEATTHQIRRHATCSGGLRSVNVTAGSASAMALQ